MSEIKNFVVVLILLIISNMIYSETIQDYKCHSDFTTAKKSEFCKKMQDEKNIKKLEKYINNAKDCCEKEAIEENKDRLKELKRAEETRKRNEFNKLCNEIDNRILSIPQQELKEKLNNNVIKECKEYAKFIKEDKFLEKECAIEHIYNKNQDELNDSVYKDTVSRCSNSEVIQKIESWKNELKNICDKLEKETSLSFFNDNKDIINKCNNSNQINKKFKQRCDEFSKKIKSLSIDGFDQQENINNADICAIKDDFDKKREEIDSLCNEAQDIANIDLEKFKLKKEEEYEKCLSFYSTISPVFKQCNTVSENIKDKDIESLENYLGEIDFKVCKKIVTEKITLLKNNETCENSRKGFIEEMRKMKKYDNQRFYEIKNQYEHLSCISLSKIIEKTQKYIENYQTGGKFQDLKVTVIITKFPDDKGNYYVIIKEKKDIFNPEEPECQTKQDKVVCDEIDVKWNPSTKYEMVIMEKVDFYFDKKKEEILLETDTLCGYTEFNKKLNPTIKKFAEVEINYRSENGEPCPWDNTKNSE